MRIAVLDDDQAQSNLVCQALESAGHACHTFSHGKEMLNQLRRDSYDMLILHWHLNPDVGCADVLRWAKERLSPNLPVIFMANQASEDEIAAGLAAGADDYIIKPIRRGELVARVQTLLRRTYPAQKALEQFQFGEYLFETRTSRLVAAGKIVELTQKEFDLALLFFRNIGRPLSRAYILEAVWSRDVEIPSRTMDTHVSRVRSKLNLRPENGYRLAPVYSYGYRLEQLTDKQLST